MSCTTSGLATLLRNTNVNDIGYVAVRIQHICLVCHVSINRNSAVPVECHMYQCKLRSRTESICVLYSAVRYTTVPITSHSLSLSTLVVIDALPTHDFQTVSFESILVQCFG